jgi:uncharacterized protein
MDAENNLPVLKAEEIRVLGCLIEKSKTTPDYYPMTLNAITAACNQKTSRKPVVDYTEETVLSALHGLKSRSLVSTAVGGSSRSTKWKHNFTTVYPLSDPELALLCLLFLRGAQTPGELNTNSGRIHEFRSLESVQETLNRLETAEPPFVKELPKRAGQKEVRYTHLLKEANDYESDEPEAPVVSAGNDLEGRVNTLERELAVIKEDMARLMKELFG